MTHSPDISTANVKNILNPFSPGSLYLFGQYEVPNILFGQYEVRCDKRTPSDSIRACPPEIQPTNITQEGMSTPTRDGWGKGEKGGVGCIHHPATKVAFAACVRAGHRSPTRRNMRMSCLLLVKHEVEGDGGY